MPVQIQTISNKNASTNTNYWLINTQAKQIIVATKMPVQNTLYWLLNNRTNQTYWLHQYLGKAKYTTSTNKTGKKMSLKDELLKAKLINKKQLKKIEHEQRVERSKNGHEKTKQKQQQTIQQIQEKQNQQKQKDQELAQLKNKELQEKEHNARIQDILTRGKIDITHGNRKFYFVTQNKKISCLLLHDMQAEKIEKGDLAIIEHPFNEFYIIQRTNAQKLQTFAPEIVRFLN